MTNETTDGFTVTWQPPIDPDGLIGYQLYVRGFAQYEIDESKENKGLIAPTAVSVDDEPWPYSDTTTEPEVCIAAVYPDGPDEDDEYDESVWGVDDAPETCATAQKPEGAAEAPAEEPATDTPDREPAATQSPSGPATEPTREEAP